jgi:hypothetical protein
VVAEPLALLTALWHPGERLAKLFRKHCSAADPPVGTLAQCDW